MKRADSRWQVMIMGLIGSFFALTVAFFSFQSITSRATSLTIDPLAETTNESLQKNPVHTDTRIVETFKTSARSTTAPMIDVLIYLQKPTIKQRVTATDREKRRAERTTYVNSLRSRTDALQQQVRSALNEQIVNKSIVIKRSFFIDNILHASITEEGLNALKNSAGVLAIVPNEQIPLPPQTTTTNLGSWNIAKIAADRVWNELNFTGTGVVVANIDTGVQWDHPALKNAYRGWNGTVADHNYNWYDPSNTSPQIPLDNTGHGTHTMGTIVGYDGTTHIGIAPGAKWIAAKGCANNGCSQSDLLAAGQWMLAPTKLDGTNPDPSKAPDVVNNSWGGLGCNPYYKGVLTSWRNAGIVPIFSSGNSGPDPNTVSSPGDNPEAISVGATDASDTIASFSSKGPSCATFDNNPKPDISAPGVAIYSSIPYDGYTTLNGTSMAAPSATGVVALLLQSKPNLTVYEIEQILKRSATDLGASGHDNTYGAGLINAYNAVTMDTGTIPTPTPTPIRTPTPTPGPIPHLTITQPNGGESYQQSQIIQITFDSYDVPYADVYLTSGTTNTVIGTIKTNALTNSPLQWTVDRFGSTNTSFKIKAVGQRQSNPWGNPITDYSDNSFTISGGPTPTPTPQLQILNPTLNEVVTEGSLYTIRWSSANIPSIYAIRLYNYTADNSLKGNVNITSGIPNANEYIWNVSTQGLSNVLPTDKYKIQILANITSMSNFFSLITPTPTQTPTPTPTATPSPTATPIPTSTPIPPTPTTQPTPTPIEVKYACTTSADCGCGLDINSNTCAIQNIQYLRVGRCTIPDFCTGISGNCGPTCVSGRCQFTCPPTNATPTPTPLKSNTAPSFITRSLARARTNKPYLSSITALDNDRDTMTMTISGLPRGLRQGICTQGIHSVKPFGTTLQCAITGTTNRMGLFTITATTKDGRGGISKSTFTLLSFPW